MNTGESEVELYIDAAVLIGEPDANSWVDHSPDWRNQHAIWEHATQTISKPTPSQQDLSSAVIQLQRSVEHRDKLLDHLYSFERIPGRRPGSKYETMADLKIIRPTLKIRLRDLRNRLMHEFDEIPLNVSDCERVGGHRLVLPEGHRSSGPSMRIRFRPELFTLQRKAGAFNNNV